MRDRLDRELVGNVSLRVLPTERPDTWEVQGRGELALAVLVETMRREGYELTVGRPTVVTKDIDGVLHEPVERLAVDVPEEFLGAVTGLLAGRKGRMETMINHGTGWVRLDYIVPARGLIGFRTQFLTDTRGTAIAHHVFEGFEPWSGPMRVRPTGSLVADRAGAVTTYACFSLQERGSLMVAPGTEVYEGMIVGENSRSDDMDVNITRERKLTNVRQSTAEELERLVPPRMLSLEQALEFCAADECVEVTPSAVRLRKAVLDGKDRARQRGRRSRGETNSRRESARRLLDEAEVDDAAEADHQAVDAERGQRAGLEVAASGTAPTRRRRRRTARCRSITWPWMPLPSGP